MLYFANLLLGRFSGGSAQIYFGENERSTFRSADFHGPLQGAGIEDRTDGHWLVLTFQPGLLKGGVAQPQKEDSPKAYFQGHEFHLRFDGSEGEGPYRFATDEGCWVTLLPPGGCLL